MSDKALRDHLKRMQTDPDYAGERHSKLEETRFAWEGFLEGCAQIAASLSDDSEAFNALFLRLGHWIREGRKQEDAPLQFREDMHEIWENRHGKT